MCVCVPEVIDMVKTLLLEYYHRKSCLSLSSSLLLIPYYLPRHVTPIQPVSRNKRKISQDFTLTDSLAQFETPNFRTEMPSGMPGSDSLEFLLVLLKIGVMPKGVLSISGE